jgi:hypothetical protein
MSILLRRPGFLIARIDGRVSAILTQIKNRCLARSREDRPFHFGSWARPNKMSVAFLQNLAGFLDLGQNRPLLDEVNCNAPSCGFRRELSASASLGRCTNAFK